MRPMAAGGLAGLVVGYGALQLLGRGSGSTADERSARLPGDEVVLHPQIRTDHATTIDAPVEEVWPWLTQVGWHRAGWYTPRWVDKLLFPANWPSLDRLEPDLVRELRVGDTIPDGPPGTAFFHVHTVRAPHVLVLHSTSHLPLGWARHGVHLAWTWCFHLSSGPPGRTRVHLRVRGRTHPWWLTAVYRGALVPADYVMAPGMLRGLKHRAEMSAARVKVPIRGGDRRDRAPGRTSGGSPRR